MKVINGTVPHYIKLQMGVSPDPERDGIAVPYIPLDESSEGVASQLARLAIAMANASECMAGAAYSPTIVNVDGKPCVIPLSDQTAITRGISQLVAPKGWDNA